MTMINQSRNEIRLRFKCMIPHHASMSNEELLSELYHHGCSKFDSIVILAELRNISRGSAKFIVEASLVMSERKESDHEFHETIYKTATNNTEE